MSENCHQFVQFLSVSAFFCTVRVGDSRWPMRGQPTYFSFRANHCSSPTVCGKGTTPGLYSGPDLLLILELML